MLQSVSRGAALLLPTVILISCGGGSGDGVGKGGDTGQEPRAALRSPPTEIGVPLGDRVSAAVGPAGGTLEYGSGELSLTITQGALEQSVEIAIESLENTAPGALGEGFRLTPNSLTFAAPVTLEFGYGDLDLKGVPPEALGIATQGTDGTWQWLDGLSVDPRTKTVRAATAHFSDFALVTGFQIRPYYRQVGTGEAVTIAVVYCYEKKEFVPLTAADDGSPQDDDLAPLVTPITTVRCTGEDIDDIARDVPATLVLARVTAWRVNGIDGGNGQLGTIAAIRNDQAAMRTDQALYKSPADVPDPNTVTISADLPWGEKGKLVATALVEISSGGGYEGSLRYTFAADGLSVSLAGNLRWPDADPGMSFGSKRFHPSGTLDATIDVETCARFSGPVRVSGDLFIDMPGEGQYTFLLVTEPGDSVLSCPGMDLPYAIRFIAPPCDGSPVPLSLGNGKALEGAVACSEGESLEWRFRRTK